jgi:hypothetical protein
MSNLIKSEPPLYYSDPNNKYDKRKNMPFIITAGVTAAGALAAGTVAGTAAVVASVTVAAAVATAASLVMTVVSFATGDKELGKIAGYVGLAGGVMGAGASIASAGVSAAGTVGTQAAKTGATEATKAGAQSAASQAITPAFQSTAAQAAASQGATGQALGSTASASLGTTGTLGTAGVTAAESSIGGISEEAAKTATKEGIKQGGEAMQGVQAPSSIPETQAPSMTKTPGNKDGGFFDFLKDNKEIISVGGAVVGAIGDYMGRKDKQATDQAELNFKKEMYYKNMPGTFGIQARNPTPGELAQYQREQAAAAREQAMMITGR